MKNMFKKEINKMMAFSLNSQTICVSAVFALIVSLFWLLYGRFESQSRAANISIEEKAMYVDKLEVTLVELMASIDGEEKNSDSDIVEAAKKHQQTIIALKKSRENIFQGNQLKIVNNVSSNILTISHSIICNNIDKDSEFTNLLPEKKQFGSAFRLGEYKQQILSNFSEIRTLRSTIRNEGAYSERRMRDKLTVLLVILIGSVSVLVLVCIFLVTIQRGSIRASTDEIVYHLDRLIWNDFENLQPMSDSGVLGKICSTINTLTDKLQGRKNMEEDNYYSEQIKEIKFDNIVRDKYELTGLITRDILQYVERMQNLINNVVESELTRRQYENLKGAYFSSREVYRLIALNCALYSSTNVCVQRQDEKFDIKRLLENIVDKIKADNNKKQTVVVNRFLVDNDPDQSFTVFGDKWRFENLIQTIITHLIRKFNFDCITLTTKLLQTTQTHHYLRFEVQAYNFHQLPFRLGRMEPSENLKGAEDETELNFAFFLLDIMGSSVIYTHITEQQRAIYFNVAYSYQVEASADLKMHV